MTHNKNIYSIVAEMRENIIKTMQQRGLKEINIVPPRDIYELQHEHEPDYSELDWDELVMAEAPAVTHYGMSNHGEHYEVLKVILEESGFGKPRFKFECKGEYRTEWFWEDEVLRCSCIDVWDSLEKKLEREPQEVWVFTAEQASDGDVEDIIIETFKTQQAADGYLHDFIHKKDEDKEESVLQYVERRKWKTSIDCPELFRAYKDGSYATDHIECTITKCKMKE